MLRTVHFHGALRKRFHRSSIQLDADSVGEAVRGLTVLLPGFGEYVRERQYVVTAANDDDELPIEREALLLNLGRRRHIHILPAAQAAGLETFLIVGLVLVAAASIASMFLLRPRVPDVNSREKKDQSFIFGGAANSTEQGHPVPIIYGGPIRVGSIVVSAGISTTDVAASAIEAGSGANYVGSTPGVLGGEGGEGGRSWEVDRAVAAKGGKGGGGGSRVAEESPNTLRSQATVKIVDLVGEGEIGGLVNGLKSVYLDDTPVQNADGSFNFSGFSLEERLGLPDQDAMPGFSQQESSEDVGEDVLFITPVVQTVTDPVVDVVRVTISVSSLFEQDTTNGDLKPSSVQIAIDHQTDGGGYTEVVNDTIQGKTNSPYQRSYDVRLVGPPPHNIRVRRITPDSELASVKNETRWDALVEVVEAKLIYPDSALYGITVDAKQFGSNIPVRSFELYGLVIDIPTNYDPVTREYTGIWDGTFKRAVSNNPAWVLNDIIKNNRYGLGARVPVSSVDKYGLYAVAQYCDGLIPDGKGGQQPRYTINACINSQESAYNVLASIASAFRGFVYWGSGSVVVTQDSPADPSLLVTPANVVDGRISYQTVIEKQKLRSVAIVYWNDPEDGYKLTPEIVEDDALVRRMGWQPGESVVRFGCTNRAEAHYAARWILDDQRYANKAAKYDAADDHTFVSPGTVISVADPKFTVGRRGGRVRAGSTTAAVNLDNPVVIQPGHVYTLRVLLPDGTVGVGEVTSLPGNRATLTLADELGVAPAAGAVWTLESDAVVNRQFRIRSATADEPPFSVYAVVHDPNSYERVEQEVDLLPSNFLELPTGPLAVPDDLGAIEFLLNDGTSATPAVQFSWKSSPDPRISFFQARFQRPGGEWETLEDSSALTRVIRNSQAGDWNFMVRAVDGLGRKTAWARGTVTLDGQADALPEVIDPTILNSPGSLVPKLIWAAPADRRPLRYEILYSATDDIDTAVSLGFTDLLEWPISMLGFYWVRPIFIDNVSPEPQTVPVVEGDLPGYGDILDAPTTLAELDPDAQGQIDDLVTTYGDTASAAASADAAALSAANAATAAANAATARSQAQDALDDAQAAQTAAEAAQASAQTAATNAASSASSAGSSATSAAGSATTATNQASAAGTSASAAAASATVATTKAADAATSASAAASSASTAATQATNAGTSASSATTSANTATTQAGIATTQATNATNASDAATKTAATLFPSDFSLDGQFFSAATTGATPATLTGTFTTVAGVGRVYQSSAYATIAPKGLIKPVAGRRYRVTVLARCTVDQTNAGGVWADVDWVGLNSSYASESIQGSTAGVSGYVSSDSSFTVADGWKSFALDFTPNSTPNAWLRPRFEYNYLSGNSTVQTASLLVEDVTNSYAAAQSASAASTSASNAAASQSAAGTSASAAATSATSAATQASNAATSASQASTSATNAAGSASTASSSATLAASSSSAAALTGALLFPSDFTNDGTFWSYQYTGLPGGALTSSGLTTTFPTVSGIGKVVQIIDPLTAGLSLVDVANLGWKTLVAGRKYRLTIKGRIVTLNAASAVLQAYIIGLDAAGTYITSGSSQSGSLVSGTWATATCDYDADTLIAAGCTYVRGLARTSRTGCTAAATIQWPSVVFEDVTGVVASAASATAAATSASNAATSASNAATSASSATTSANTATTQASNAATSASSAATSATNAAGSAATASTNATLAANSSTAAHTASLATIPDNFTDPTVWQNYAGWGGSVTFNGVIARTFNGGSLRSLANIPLSAGQRYRLTARHRVVNQGGGVTYIGCLTYPNNYNPTWIVAAQASAALNTWQVTTADFDASTYLSVYPNETGLSPMILIGYSNVSDGEVSQLRIENITSTKQASDSASAAATSASAASTSASAAGTSATSATTSANTASTQAGNASSSASSASSSAASASSSASSASSSATLAASVAVGSLLKNSNFTGTLASGGARPQDVPPNWLAWQNTNTYGYRTGLVGGGLEGPDAYRDYAELADVDTGIYQNISAGPGKYTLSATMRCQAGNFTGAGLLVYAGDAGLATIYGAAVLDFAADPMINGTVLGSTLNLPSIYGSSYVYRWQKSVQFTDSRIRTIRIYNMAKYGAMTSTANSYRIIDWHRGAIRATSDAEAAVMTSAGVVVDVANRIATSQWEAVTSAGGATAALRLESKSIGGVASSSVALEANEIQLWNDVAGTRKKAMSVSGGDVIFYGSITAEAGIFLGSGIKWSPQLQMKDFQVTDGTAVSFGYNLGNTPLFDFKGNGLAPLASGETYRLYADSASGTGFTPRLRIITPDTTSSYSLTTDTTPGTGPTRQIDKAANPDATNNTYTVRIQGTFTDTAFTTGGGGGGGWNPGGGGNIP